MKATTLFVLLLVGILTVHLSAAKTKKKHGVNKNTECTDARGKCVDQKEGCKNPLINKGCPNKKEICCPINVRKLTTLSTAVCKALGGMCSNKDCQKKPSVVYRKCTEENRYCCVPPCKRKTKCIKKKGYCAFNGFCPWKTLPRGCKGKACDCCLPSNETKKKVSLKNNNSKDKPKTKRPKAVKKEDPVGENKARNGGGNKRITLKQKKQQKANDPGNGNRENTRTGKLQKVKSRKRQQKAKVRGTGSTGSGDNGRNNHSKKNPKKVKQHIPLLKGQTQGGGKQGLDRKTFCANFCLDNGGFCLTKKQLDSKTACPSSPKNYTPKLGFCTGRPCLCCINVRKLTTLSTAVCKSLGGMCSNKDCPNKSSVVYRKCTEENSYCCVPPCKRKTKCTKKKGYCAFKGFCPWKTLPRGCKGKACDCCLPKCIKKNKCANKNGECYEDSCLPGEKEIPKGCKGKGCSCCVSIPPCKSTKKCSKNKGNCIPTGTCKDGTVMPYCKKNCECCIDPDVCTNLKACNTAGGQCINSALQSNCKSNEQEIPNACKESECKCCAPTPSTTTTTNSNPDVCKNLKACDTAGGQCINRALQSNCKSNEQEIPYACKESECRCCAPTPTTTSTTTNTIPDLCTNLIACDTAGGQCINIALQSNCKSNEQEIPNACKEPECKCCAPTPSTTTSTTAATTTTTSTTTITNIIADLCTNLQACDTAGGQCINSALQSNCKSNEQEIPNACMESECKCCAPTPSTTTSTTTSTNPSTTPTSTSTSTQSGGGG